MNYGVIRISTNPSGAIVSVNSVKKGTTPIDIINVYPGIYNITLAYSGLDSYNFDTVVISGKMTLVSFNFILQEVTESNTDLVGNDLVIIKTPPGMPIEQQPNMPGIPSGTYGETDQTTESPPGTTTTTPTSDRFGFVTEEITTETSPASSQTTDSGTTATTSDGGTTESGMLSQHLADMNVILDKNNSLMSEVRDTLNLLSQYIGKTSGFDPNEKYYSTQQIAITVATPIKPNNSDIIADATTGAPGYDRIPVYDVMQRNSRSISVINDGTEHLFVLTSADGKRFSAQENPILVGESRIFHNIWEMRIRSKLAGDLVNALGGIYRVTEYDYSLSYSSTVLSSQVNRADFRALVVNAPQAGVMLPNVNIPNGLALTIRANVNNGLGFVYVANSIVNAVNAAIPGLRVTLAAGDVARLYILDANLVAIAGSSGAENVDILVEI